MKGRYPYGRRRACRHLRRDWLRALAPSTWPRHRGDMLRRTLKIDDGCYSSGNPCRCHASVPPRSTADIRRPAASNSCRGLCRSPVRLADNDDGPFAGGQIRAVPADIGERHIERARQMAGRRRKFFWLPHIDQRHAVARRKAPLQFAAIDPCRLAACETGETAGAGTRSWRALQVREGRSAEPSCRRRRPTGRHSRAKCRRWRPAACRWPRPGHRCGARCAVRPSA